MPLNALFLMLNPCLARLTLEPGPDLVRPWLRRGPAEGGGAALQLLDRRPGRLEYETFIRQ
ncbi:hypothetical protein BKK79_20610 [Cupriavidus sp. USMAA2-4]|uniref:Uncharacterized protein n=1 Tax=Cupriavidus malaysiensis TaxID=367825 RepID=A0ABM6FDS6_9BURK|nr:MULTISPECIES: hypothetical protein [Cupriavidus]AOY94369.1 hypothetical protein BKK79_20610 [Cupriavidus sp. USMAA2-4]AOZ09911.1 hypothetical protein BKK80_29960 [Cupriavidus malaysiensis]